MEGKNEGDTGVQVAVTRVKGGIVQPLEAPIGAPKVPLIGGKPDRTTQNISLIDILNKKNKLPKEGST